MDTYAAIAAVKIKPTAFEPRAATAAPGPQRNTVHSGRAPDAVALLVAVQPLAVQARRHHHVVTQRLAPAKPARGCRQLFEQLSEASCRSSWLDDWPSDVQQLTISCSAPTAGCTLAPPPKPQAVALT